MSTSSTAPVPDEQPASAGHYDAVVLGAGPAGSTAATLIRRRGHRVLLLEKETFPRWQIGESLLPATVHGIASLLGVRERLAEAGFTRKQGGTFRWGASPEPWTFEFSVSPKMPGPTSFAYQVERSRFDKILLDNAAEHGVEVREGCPVQALRRSQGPEGRIDTVDFVTADGSRQRATTRFVVDATGNSSGLHREIGAERRSSPYFRNLAVFGYFLDGGRLPQPRSGNIFSVAFEHGWFWYIPLTPELTSVGAVLSQESAGLLRGGDRRRVLNDMIAACPEIAALLADARPCDRAPYDEVRVRRDWSYTSTRFHGDGLVLVGDAACFVDPVFSSGVHLATYSALLAARAINAHLEGAVDEEVGFAEFERRYRQEYQLFHDFLVGFYDMHEVESSYFWRARRITSSAASAPEAFVELVGGVANVEYGDGLGRAAAMSHELAGMVGRSADAGHRTGALAGPETARVMAVGADLQGLTAGAGRAAAGTRDGGLGVSEDSLAWRLDPGSSEAQATPSTVLEDPDGRLGDRTGARDRRLPEAG